MKLHICKSIVKSTGITITDMDRRDAMRERERERLLTRFVIAENGHPFYSILTHTHTYICIERIKNNIYTHIRELPKGVEEVAALYLLLCTMALHIYIYVYYINCVANDTMFYGINTSSEQSFIRAQPQPLKCLLVHTKHITHIQSNTQNTNEYSWPCDISLVIRPRDFLKRRTWCIVVVLMLMLLFSSVPLPFCVARFRPVLSWAVPFCCAMLCGWCCCCCCYNCRC